jgi:hypothetical protein
LLSDRVISIAGHSFTIHHFGLYLAAAILLFAVIFFLWGYFRGRRVAAARTIRRDELSIYFGRMADSLEMLQRVASRIASNMTVEAPRPEPSRQEVFSPGYTRQQDEASRENAPPAVKPSKEAHSVSLSMFGR